MPMPRLVMVEQPVVRVQLFGAMDARTYIGDIVLPRGLKARAILAYLALAEDDVVPRKRFLSLLWSQRWEEQARASMRQSIRELNTAFAGIEPPVLTVTRDDIKLDRRYVWIEGLSTRVGANGDPASRLAPDSFLESLTELDPKFDAWIGEMRAAIKARTTIAAVISSTPVARFGGVRAPRVDVMPFDAFGAEAGNAHMAPALSHELATGLARFRWISVRLASGQVQTPENAPDYRLEGHLAHAPDGGRLTIRLADQSDAGAIVWSHAETIVGPLRPAFIAEIAERVVARLDPEILAIETRKVTHGPEVAGDAYALLLQAIPKLHARTFGRETWAEGKTLLERALVIAPDFGRVQAFLAQANLQGLAQGWTPMTPAGIETIDRLALAAITSDPLDSIGLALAGHIRSFVHRDFAGAKNFFRRAIAANPNCCFAWGYSALTYAYAGEASEARSRLTRAQHVLQHGPYELLSVFNAVVTYQEGDWVRAIVVTHDALVRMPALTNLRKLMIAAMCMLKRFDDAAAEQKLLLALEPSFSWDRHIETYPFARLADRLAMRRAIIAGGLMIGEPRSAAEPLQRCDDDCLTSGDFR